MYREIGIIIVALLAVSSLLSMIALNIFRIDISRHPWLAGRFAAILDFFYYPLKFLIRRFSSPSRLDMWMARIKNIANEEEFRRTSDRIIVAPHCMRHRECPASTTRFGIDCISCGRCIYASLGRDAKRYGYRLYIIPGSSFVRRILSDKKNRHVDGILAIGCWYELNKGMRELSGYPVTTYGIPLTKDGCFDTCIDYRRTISLLKQLDNNKKKKR